MACDMFETAKSLVRASLPEVHGVELKTAMFERFYGHEFDDATKERIKDHIADLPPCVNAQLKCPPSPQLGNVLFA